MKLDIGDTERKYQKVMEEIASSNILEQNKKLIKEFLNELECLGRAKATLFNTVVNLQFIADNLQKPFNEANKEDIIKLVKIIEQRYKSNTTKLVKKYFIKKFWKWLRQTEEYPPEVKWIKQKKEYNNNSEQYLTEAEIIKLIENAPTVRDKAFLGTLWETGTRIGEILPIQIKDISFDQYGCMLAIDGKTGKRLVRVVENNKYLMAWLDICPVKNDTEGFVWSTNTGKRLTYMGIYGMLRRLCKKIQLKKKFNPHRFRKSRSTYLSAKLPEAVVKSYMGWTEDSKMLKVYTNISNETTDTAILGLHNIKPENKPKEIENRVCQKCGEVNSILTSFCKKCQTPMELKTFIQLDNTRNEYDSFVKDFLLELAKQNPQTKELFARMVKERNLEGLFK
jgi:site-specific recombinase XerD/ribosomal protein L40E